jgi:hypothetical protein
MSRTRALQGNAADPKQVRFAARHNDRLESRYREDMRLALMHLPTRRLLMRILYEARCDLAHLGDAHPEHSASVWDPSAKIHYHSGRRDLGLLIQGWIAAADPTALLSMLADELTRVAQLEHEVAAAHTPPATSAGGSL